MPALSDEYVVRVLRPFVVATGPVLRGIRDADPFRLGRLARRRAITTDERSEPAAVVGPAPTGSALRRARHGLRAGRERGLDRLATSKLPGTPRWAVMSPEERDRWWVGRVGRFTSVVASIPGIGGALARRLPVSDVIGLAAQGLVVCAIAADHGIDDHDEQVRLLGAVLFGRDLDPSRHGDSDTAEVEREAGELTGELPVDGTAGRGASERGLFAALARAVWRMGRALFALHDELDRRPKGHKIWRILANLPVVGAIASYRNERSGLRRAARETVARVPGGRGR